MGAADPWLAVNNILIKYILYLRGVWQQSVLDMSRGTNIKLRTAEEYNQSSSRGTKVTAQMPTVEREANNMALG